MSSGMNSGNTELIYERSSQKVKHRGLDLKMSSGEMEKNSGNEVILS